MTDINLNFELHPKQLIARRSPAQFVLYGGAAGGGKSHLNRVEAITACLDIPGLQVYIFRRRYSDLISNHMEGPTSFHGLLSDLVAAKKCKIGEIDIRFFNGSAIHLRHCQHEKDVYNYQGADIHFLILEEATQFLETQIRYLLSRVRIPDAVLIPRKYQGIYPRILASSNPGNVSHSFWKSTFVDVYERLKHEGEPYPTWRMRADDGGRLAQFIPARLSDNPSINPEEYRKALAGLKRKELIDSLLEGRWDVPLGAMFPELNENVHRIKSFEIPDYWFRFRTFDWGSSSPFAVQWWAVADGKAGKLPKNSLVLYREWYGGSEFDKSKGLALSNEQLVAGILQRSPKEELIQGTVTDSKPFQANGGRTIAEDFKTYGVPLQLGDVSKGSRVQGWQQLRSRLIGSNGIPTIYVFEACKDTWRTLVGLQTDDTNVEDADTDGEDHAPDAVSLACKARPYVIEKPSLPSDISDYKPTFNDAISYHIKQSQRTGREDRR